MFIAAIPRKVWLAVLNEANPIPGFVSRLTKLWRHLYSSVGLSLPVAALYRQVKFEPKQGEN